MKGAIFTILQDMIEDQMGIDVWQDIISTSDLPSGGVYTSAQHYDDEEVFVIVGALAEKTGLPAEQLLEAYGEYLFDKLHSSLPSDMRLPESYFDYLESVHTQIHVEVRKLDANASLPELALINRSETAATLEYRSKLKLCYLAIGLLKGSATFFNENVNVSMPRCMHEGADCCHLNIELATSA